MDRTDTPNIYLGLTCAQTTLRYLSYPNPVGFRPIQRPDLHIPERELAFLQFFDERSANVFKRHGHKFFAEPA